MGLNGLKSLGAFAQGIFEGNILYVAKRSTSAHGQGDVLKGSASKIAKFFAPLLRIWYRRDFEVFSDAKAELAYLCDEVALFLHEGNAATASAEELRFFRRQWVQLVSIYNHRADPLDNIDVEQMLCTSCLAQKVSIPALQSFLRDRPPPEEKSSDKPSLEEVALLLPRDVPRSDTGEEPETRPAQGAPEDFSFEDLFFKRKKETSAEQQDRIRRAQQFLRTNARTNLNAIDGEKGLTPIHYAAFYGNQEMLDFLLNQPLVNRKQFNQQGQTALHSAVINKQMDTARLLLAKEPTLIDVQDERGRTALHWAAVFGHKEMIALLLENNASKTLRDEEGKRPVDLAPLEIREIF